MILPGSPRFGTSAAQVVGPIEILVAPGVIELAGAIADVAVTEDQTVLVVPGVIEAVGAVATVGITADQFVTVVPRIIEAVGAVPLVALSNALVVDVIPGVIEASGAVATVTVASPPSISFFNSSVSSLSTISMPASIQAGDLAILCDYALNASGAPADVVPSLFTQFGTSLVMATNYKRILSYKVLDGTETTITGMNGTSANRKTLIVFRKASGTWSAPQDVAEQTTSGDPSAQVVNVSGESNPVVVIGSYAGTGTVSTRTMTPTKDSEVTAANNVNYLAWCVYNSSPADTTVDMGDSGTGNILSSFYFELT